MNFSETFQALYGVPADILEDFVPQECMEELRKFVKRINESIDQGKSDVDVAQLDDIDIDGDYEFLD